MGIEGFSQNKFPAAPFIRTMAAQLGVSGDNVQLVELVASTRRVLESEESGTSLQASFVVNCDQQDSAESVSGGLQEFDVREFGDSFVSALIADNVTIPAGLKFTKPTPPSMLKVGANFEFSDSNDPSANDPSANDPSANARNADARSADDRMMFMLAGGAAAFFIGILVIILVTRKHQLHHASAGALSGGDAEIPTNIGFTGTNSVGQVHHNELQNNPMFSHDLRHHPSANAESKPASSESGAAKIVELSGDGNDTVEGSISGKSPQLPRLKKNTLTHSLSTKTVGTSATL
jgi:hypothetical protein